MTFTRRTAIASALAILGVTAPADARQAKPSAPGTLRLDQRAPAAPAPENKDIRIRTSVSQTAFWVGDQVEFVVEVTCAPNLDVIDEDLAKDKLKLNGLDIVSDWNERVAGEGGGTIRRFHYLLSAYDIGKPTLSIGPQTVRYYVRRAGERPQDVQPAGEVQFGAIALARRSTLPDELQGLDLRDAGVLASVPAWLNAARALGIGLIVLSAAPLAVWGAAVVRRSRARERRPSARVVRTHARAALDELQALDASSESGRVQAYAKLDHALRRHLVEKRGIPADALSAREIAARLGTDGSAETTSELLAECERARFAPPERVPPLDRFKAALERASEVLGTAS